MGAAGTFDAVAKKAKKASTNTEGIAPKKGAFGRAAS